MAKVESPKLSDVPGLVAVGIRSFRSDLVGHVLSALPVFAVFAVARIAATSVADGGQVIGGLLIDALGSVVATVVALPWFRRALQSVRDRDLPGNVLDGIGAMVVGSIFFWLGVLLGLRYLFGIPSLVIFVMYAFFGFAIADGQTSGMHALGTSVRIGQGRRIVVFAVALVLGVLNLLAAAPLAGGLTAASVGIAVVLLTVTTGVSMGAGAEFYDRLLQSEEVNHANT